MGFTIDKNAIEKAILNGIANSRNLPAELDTFLDTVAETRHELAPEATGTYKRSIKKRIPECSLQCRRSPPRYRRRACVLRR